MASKTAETSFLATRRGKLTLALLCAIAFLDFVDASIVNIALPSIRRALHFSEGDLQWVPSGYLLTYGGFMLLGGRAADLLGRRRVLVAGVVVIGVSSLLGGFAASSGMLIGARFAQGLGAAMTLPAALSLLTTSFKEGKDRNVALGAWGGSAAMASAAGVLLGGLLTAGPGWRWVMFVNPIACALVLWPTFQLIKGDRPRSRLQNFDALGAALATGGMLLLVYALVKAPEAGWGTARTIGELAGAVGLLVAFVVNEQRKSNPLMPLSIFRVKGLAAADATQLVAVAGFLAMFFYLNLYMQNVLGYSALQVGALYLPPTFAIGIAAAITPQFVSRFGTRPVIVAGAAVASGGVYWLSRIPVHGSFLHDVLPAILVFSFGVGPLFVAITTAANAGVATDKAGLAASLLNASQQLGGALGLAIYTAVATSRTNDLLAAHAPMAQALTAGFQRAFLVGSILVAAAGLIGLRATNTRGEAEEVAAEALPDPAVSSAGGLTTGAGARVGLR
jgi:EmrB/QacA subfamily drug resistance transporter